jgi:hypothetical protein
VPIENTDNTLALLVADYAKELSVLLDSVEFGDGDQFDSGRKLGLIQAAMALIREAEAFEVDLKQIGLLTLKSRSDLL